MPVRSGEHELFDAFMATAPARAEVNARLQALTRGIRAASTTFAGMGVALVAAASTFERSMREIERSLNRNVIQHRRSDADRAEEV